MTVTLLMQLVDDRLISLDDLVVTHLPDLRLRDIAALQKITCKMLLNHTSGINGMMLSDHGPDQERIEDCIARCAEMDQLHAPGEGPSYCNAALVIAGYLVQRLRGKSWYTLVKERIFSPLGLAHSLVELGDLPLFRVSVGDVTDPATGKLVQSTRPFLPLSFAPAGATTMMSAEDLVNFGRAHVAGGVGPNGVRILSEASTRLMQQSSINILEPREWRWGLGWILFSDQLIGHGGGGPGIASMLYLHPASGRVAAVLTNSDQGATLYTPLLRDIFQDWTGVTPTVTSSDRTASMTVDLAPYIGRYVNNMMTIDIVEIDGGLGIRVAFGAKIYDNQSTDLSPPVLMRALGDHAFLHQTKALLGDMVRFVGPDDTGKCPAIGNFVHIFVRAHA